MAAQASLCILRAACVLAFLLSFVMPPPGSGRGSAFDYAGYSEEYQARVRHEAQAAEASAAALDSERLGTRIPQPRVLSLNVGSKM